RIEGESWISGRRPPDGPLACKIRSTGEPADAFWTADGGLVRFAGGAVRGAAPGQSAVLYRGEEVLGGGAIAARTGA
ncbi:MAG: tRNA 2-thiouridine(34) synthase MnmA, partial [Kiritimatiellae bacterium]|nr:tRNA 2-thiouridine(34) synthase MnmA [Kiritimatiellia bacterium]